MNEQLSDSFWKPAEGAFKNEGTLTLHTELVMFLREEFQQRPGLGVVEMMMVERTAFFYCWVRDREQSGIGREGHVLSPDEAQKGVGFVQERNYKEAIQLLTDMLARLQRASQDTSDAATIRAEAFKQFTRVMLATIETLRDDIQEEVRDRFAMAYEKADF